MAWNTADTESSEVLWAIFDAILSKFRSKSLDDIDRLKCELMVTLMVPRIDVNVTSQINHLIKSPFSAHPDTGKISIPIDIEDCTFDPKVVCTFDTFEITPFRNLLTSIEKTTPKIAVDN